MLAAAKSQAKEKERPFEKPEEPLAPRPGESIVEDVDVHEALEEIGKCPASFEWIQLGEQAQGACDVCHEAVAAGDFRCAGGSHFVCYSCIDRHCKEGRS